MADKKEVKKLLNYARKIVNKRVYKTLKKLHEEDKEPVIKHAIKTRLENDYEELRQKVRKMKEQGKEVFFIETKLHALNGKIKLFTATHHKRDFVKVREGFKKIKGEMKNV